MDTHAGLVDRGERARRTIWRLFEQRRLSANAATSRLLMVDLATWNHGSGSKPAVRDSRGRAGPGRARRA